MSDIGDSIALAHRMALVDQEAGTVKCTCGTWTPSKASEGMLDVLSRHVAEVTEAQVRAQVAADIEARRDNYGWGNTEAGCFTIAARIARGESS